MQGLLDSLQRSEEFKSILRGIKNGLRQQMVCGLSGSQRSYLLAALVDKMTPPAPLLVVTPGEREARDLAEELIGFLPGAPVKLFPAKANTSSLVLAHSREIHAQRLQTLEGLCTGSPMVIFAAAEALLQPLIPPDVLHNETLYITVGNRLDPVELI